jgi:hypothetical protein
MAARNSGGGESKTGLVISLVFFVLTTIILGVATWQGFAGQAELETKAKEAAKKEADMKRERDQERLRLAVMKTVGGVADESDTSNLALKSSFKDAYDKSLASLTPLAEYGVTWASNIDRPSSNVRDALAKYVADTRQALADKDQAIKDRDGALANLQAKITETEAELAKAKENVAKSSKAAVDAQNTNATKYTDALAQIEAQNQKNAKLQLDSEANDAAKKRKIAELQAQVAQLQQVRDKLVADKPQLDILEVEQPKGKIVRLDRNRNTAFINLGSADRVRPQLTFSILPADAVGKGAAGRARKGALEVVSVIGDHMSEAKITEVVNPNRDPLVTGDVLFNTAWSPNLREHVAICGLIDLNGDGTDDTPELVRSLEKQGVIVDEYLDLRDLTQKKTGDGMGYQTTYLIIGEQPTYSANMSPGDRAADRIASVIAKMAEMKNRAKEMGIQQITARRFLTASGFPMPRVTQPGDFTSGAYKRGSVLPPKPPEGEQPEPKPEPKKGDKEGGQ